MKDGAIVEGMIRRVFIDNYRCLVNFEFRPARVNLLIGANGSGKSTFLEAINQLRGFARGLSVAALAPSTLPWWDKRLTQTFEVDVADPEGGEDIRYRVRIAHPSSSTPTRFVEERLSKGDTEVLSVGEGGAKMLGDKGKVFEFPFQGPTTALSSGMGGHPIVERFRAVFGAGAFFRINPWSISETSSSDDSGLNPNASNFAAWLRARALDDPKAYSVFQDRIGEALPQFRSLRQFDLGGGNRMLVAAASRGQSSEALIPFSDFSEGEKCLCVLHAIAAFRSLTSTLALDEPDNFLSLREVQPVLSHLVDAGAPQLFVVTHHPEAIDYLAADSTWLFERPSGEQVRVSPMVFDRSRGERPSETVKMALP